MLSPQQREKHSLAWLRARGKRHRVADKECVGASGEFAEGRWGGGWAG